MVLVLNKSPPPVFLTIFWEFNPAVVSIFPRNVTLSWSDGNFSVSPNKLVFFIPQREREALSDPRTQVS